MKEMHVDLQRILDGAPLDELREQVNKRRQDAETHDLRRRLGEIVIQLLDRAEDDESTPCPVCEVESNRNEIRNVMQAAIRAEGGKGSEELREMEDRMERARKIENDIQILDQEIENYRNEIGSMIVEQNFESIENCNEKRIVERIEAADKLKASLESRIGDFESWRGDARKKLDKIHEEIQYHALQKRMIRKKSVEEDMKGVQKTFEDLVLFGESAKDVRDSVERTLTKELRKKTPGVAENLTRAFCALTRHSYFDQLVFAEEKLPNLELEVASSRDSHSPSPSSVLNGQAQSALELVPYFALSQEDESLTEIYLVLLDDPTRAFDREHIEILIEQLTDLGKRVQLVVATHETEAFLDLLPKKFDPESYVVIEPKDWSPADGPKLDIK